MTPPLSGQGSSAIIGWKEVVNLPDWGVRSLVAKSDTGALGSAIDVKNIVDQGNGWVEFDIVLDRRNRRQTMRIAALISKKSKIRSSNGVTQERYKVRTTLQIGKILKEVEFSLVNRRRMICRILLGRSALSPEFIVDPQGKYLHGKRKRVSVSNLPKHKRHISQRK